MNPETRKQTTSRFIKEAMDQLAIDDAIEIARANKQAEGCGNACCRNRAKATEKLIYGYWEKIRCEKEFKKTGVVFKKKQA